MLRRLFFWFPVAAAAALHALPTTAAPGPAAVELSCKSRVPAGPGDLAFEPDALLRQGMVGKPYKLAAGVAQVTMESTLVQYYGLRQSLKSVHDDQGRSAISRLAQLVENNYVIAAQMSLGASALRGEIPASLLDPIARYVITLTEPYEEDEELKFIQGKTRQGHEMVALITEKARPFARWAVLGYGWGDRVAIDASLSGFCAAKPTPADVARLERAINASQLDLSKKFPPIREHDHDHE